MAAKSDGIDIDVVGDFPRRFDKTIDAFRRILTDAVVAATVKDMVEKVLKRLSERGKNFSQAGPVQPKINRLRIFGHSSGNYVALSRFDEALPGRKINTAADMGQKTRERALSADIVGIGSDEKFTYGGNYDQLEKLVGRFSQSGWVELHACYIAPGFSGDLAASKIDHAPYGKYLLLALASLWRVPVMGGTDKQHPGGGLEGEVVIAYPNGKIRRIPPKPKEQKEEWIKCNMATGGSYRGGSRAPNVLASGVVSTRQPVLGVGESDASVG